MRLGGCEATLTCSDNRYGLSCSGLVTVNRNQKKKLDASFRRKSYMWIEFTLYFQCTVKKKYIYRTVK